MKKQTLEIIEFTITMFIFLGFSWFAYTTGYSNGRTAMSYEIMKALTN